MAGNNFTSDAWRRIGLCCLMSAGLPFFTAEAPAAAQYSGGSFADPFDIDGILAPSAVSGGASEAPAPMTLEGVVWGTKTPQAVVDGQVVKVGGTVSGAKVTAIDQTGVRLEQNGEEIYLRVKRGGTQ